MRRQRRHGYRRTRVDRRLTDAATKEIEEIWAYSAERYGFDHAGAYAKFLNGRIYALSTEFNEGRPVAGRPELRQIMIRKGWKGHGHVAVYRVAPATVNVLHVFHTAQNVHGRLAGGA